MKWYFGLSESSIDRPEHEWRDMIRVAVQSALMRTSLQPVMLYDGTENPFISELRLAGVQIIFHRVGFYDTLKNSRPDDMAYLSIASGAFLRFDICRLETEPYALYTDCDVIFQNEPDFMGVVPPLFAATSQSSEDPAEDMNSGVMLINVNGMRSEYDALVRFTCANLHLGFDQEIMRVFFDRRYTAMDRSLNWKPYWGYNHNAQIVHFHGPKPGAARAMHARGTGVGPELWHVLHGRSPDGYAHYVQEFDALLDAYNKRAGASRSQSAS